MADQPELLHEREKGWQVDLQLAQQILQDLGRECQLESAVAEAAHLVHDHWQVIRSLAELWIENSEENYGFGDPQYFMAGSELRQIVESFRTRGLVARPC